MSFAFSRFVSIAAVGMALAIQLVIPLRASADSTFTGPIKQIVRLHPGSDGYASYQGSFRILTGGVQEILYYSGSVCSGFGGPSTADLEILEKAADVGTTVVLYYKTTGAGNKCYSGFRIDY